MTPRLELVGICKRFAGVVANDGISLAVAPGEIHAVLGENGAGKSTLMKIVYGVLPADAGEIRFDGRPVAIRTPHEARALGIAMVFQHFSLFDTLTVAENVWLALDDGAPLADVVGRIRATSASYGLEVDPLQPVHALSVGERQRVEIVRALLARPRLLILDEPTSVLAPAAVEKLFEFLRRLAAEGCAILYISHKLDEVRALAHRCTVLRAGRLVATVEPANESNASLSRLMIGAEPPQVARTAPHAGAVALEVRALTLPRIDRFEVALEGIELAVRAGEIVGIAGVAGNGQRELASVLSGEDRRAPPGSITLFGADIAQASPRRRRRLGLRFVPQERLGRGAVPALSLDENTLLTRDEPLGLAGWIRRDALRRLTARVLSRFDVKAAGTQAPARSLSGGNLQKFVVGREIDAAPKVLVLEQPTWGVDVGASARIRNELLRLRDEGCALLVFSEDLEELFEICDRLHVMARGRLSPPLATAAATVERVGAWMSGLWPDAAGAREASDVAA